MDPLSLTASVLGIISAAAKVTTTLYPIVVSAKNAPKHAASVYSEANSIRSVLSALQEYLVNLASAPRARVALIQLDQLILTLTDAVLTFSELEAILAPLRRQGEDRFLKRSRLQWVWDERVVFKILTKLQRHNSSLSLMLNIIQCESDLRAARAQKELETQMTGLLESNQALARRLKGLEDAFDARSTFTRRVNSLAPRRDEHAIITGERPLTARFSATSFSAMIPSTWASRFAFEQDLESSFVYRRANRESCGVSVRSSVLGSNAWSIFSGLSLADVSVISVIGLPVYSSDITNIEHYTFGNPGPQPATQQVLHAREKPSPSLFHTCINMGQRLGEVPEFKRYLLEEVQNADEDTNPVTVVWRTFRRGEPLVVLYNALAPDHPLQIDNLGLDEEKRPKHTTFKFLEACVTYLKIPAMECFMITDLYSDDTTRFVKVIRHMERIVDMLELAGVISSQNSQLEPSDTSEDKSPQGCVTDMLVKEERIYVRHLEQIQEFREQVEENGNLTKDATYNIFGPLDQLVEAHRRFLIDLEVLYASPEEEQNLGQLFVRWTDRLEPIYMVYITEQQRFYEAALMEFSRLNQTGGPNVLVGSPSQLTLFLLEPAQRLPRYHELLEELRRVGDFDEEMQTDLSEGIESVRWILEEANNIKAANELKTRVADWKGVSFNRLGKLLISGTFLVSTRVEKKKNQIYLFETALVLCKKPPTNIRGRASPKEKGEKGNRQKSTLLLANCTRIRDVSLISTSFIDDYECRVHWLRGQKEDYFIIHFPTEDLNKKWNDALTIQRRAYASKSP